jgi:hypothetical protein
MNRPSLTVASVLRVAAGGSARQRDSAAAPPSRPLGAGGLQILRTTCLCDAARHSGVQRAQLISRQGATRASPSSAARNLAARRIQGGHQGARACRATYADSVRSPRRSTLLRRLVPGSQTIATHCGCRPSPRPARSTTASSVRVQPAPSSTPLSLPRLHGWSESRPAVENCSDRSSTRSAAMTSMEPPRSERAPGTRIASPTRRASWTASLQACRWMSLARRGH